MTVIDLTDPSLRDELVEIVRETLDGLDEMVVEHAPLADVTGHADIVIESKLSIDGDDAAAGLVLRVPAPNAIALTAAMTGEDAGAVTLGDAIGAVGELCNMLAGTAKTLLAEETALHVPQPTAVAVDQLTPLDTVVVPHRLGRFEVHLGG